MWTFSFVISAKVRHKEKEIFQACELKGMF